MSTALLRPGKNVIGVEVLFYGLGDGTWPAGKPGMIFNLAIEQADGRRERIVSDPSWQMMIDRSHRPGQFKRWYLRSLQEEFDARLHPFGWDTPEFSRSLAERLGRPAMTVAHSGRRCSAVLRPTSHRLDATRIPGPTRSSGSTRTKCCLRMRQIPGCSRRRKCRPCGWPMPGRVHWLRDPADWFEFRLPNCFRIERQP